MTVAQTSAISLFRGKRPQSRECEDTDFITFVKTRGCKRDSFQLSLCDISCTDIDLSSDEVLKPSKSYEFILMKSEPLIEEVCRVSPEPKYAR